MRIVDDGLDPRRFGVATPDDRASCRKTALMAKGSWTLAELQAELQRFRREAERAGLKPHTVDTYVGRSEQFVWWPGGDFQFRGPNS